MITVGLTEEVFVVGEKRIKATAKFDTGAKHTSIDTNLAKEVGIGPVIETKKVKSGTVPEGVERDFVNLKLELFGKVYETKANLNERPHSVAKVLIGRDLILNNFQIDVSKTHKGPAEKDFIS